MTSAQPWRAMRVGETQSKVSIPARTLAKTSAKVPMPKRCTGRRGWIWAEHIATTRRELFGLRRAYLEHQVAHQRTGLVGELHAEFGAGRLTLAARDGTATLLAVAAALQADGIGVDDLSLRQPSLDEAFLALTGVAA